MKALFCGSFCPVTVGHVDVIQRAAKLCDTLFVVVAENERKSYEMDTNNRLKLLSSAVSHVYNVKITAWGGLIADFCKQNEIDLIIKSVRNVVDFQYESDMAKYNKELCGVETVFLPCDSRYAHVSSTYVRELAHNGASIANYVPNGLEKQIFSLLKGK